MKDLIKNFIEHWRKSFIFRTLASSLVSTAVGLFFIIFNGALGIIYGSRWHGTICIYYILLTTIRSTIIFFQRNATYRSATEGLMIRQRVSKYTHIALFFLNVALIAPIAMMVNGERHFEYGLVPAIVMAAYTVYRVVFSTINLNRSKKQYNCLVRELRAINMMDTLVAVLSLQNAMLVAKGTAIEGGMAVFVSFTSVTIFALIEFVTVRSVIKNHE